ncbi:hypothetical protein FRC10_008180, partial [Ceratobasidium sp. 414]
MAESEPSEGYTPTGGYAFSSVPLGVDAVVGVLLQAEAGLVSLTSILILLAIILCNYRRNRSKPPPGPWRLFRGNMDILM